MKFKFLAVLSLTFILGVASYYVFYNAHPSDKNMETFFLEHEEDFEKLRKMFEEDKNCSTISIYGNSPVTDYSKRPPEAVCEISEDRQNEYIKLFKKLNIRTLITRDYHQHDLMFFTTSFKGDDPNPDGESLCTKKGYAFTLNPRFESLESLDGIKNSDITFWDKKYKKLKGNWYLYYAKGLIKPE